MRIINRPRNKFSIGSRVVITKRFVSGMVSLDAGTLGRITGDYIENLPDIGLFNIRVLNIDFGQYHISVGEMVAKEYMRPL